jgi:hypothetical protein
MKALSEENPFDLSKIRVDRIWVGDAEIMGECVLSIKPPLKGTPFWEVRYDVGAGINVLYAASTPIRIEAVEIKQEQVEEKELGDDE